MMTAEQFQALAELIKLRGGKSQEAARLVLVADLTPAEAARQAGATPQAVNSVLRSCERGTDLARRVVTP